MSISPRVSPLAPNALGNVIAPHGIIGQSWDGDDIGIDGAQDNLGQLRQDEGKEVTTRAQAEGAIEGTMEEYLVDNEFSTNFKYSRWDVVAAEPRNISALKGAKKRLPSTMGDEIFSHAA